MLVLSRKINQSVIIGESLRVRLSRIEHGSIDLSWNGAKETLNAGEAIEVTGGVLVRLVKAGKHQARISIDAARDIIIHREEVHNRIMQARTFAS